MKSPAPYYRTLAVALAVSIALVAGCRLVHVDSFTIDGQASDAAGYKRFREKLQEVPGTRTTREAFEGRGRFVTIDRYKAKDTSGQSYDVQESKTDMDDAYVIRTLDRAGTPNMAN